MTFGVVFQVEASETRWKDLRNTLMKMKNDQFDLESAFVPFSEWKPQTGMKAVSIVSYISCSKM
jgi:hypothetical protein